MPESVPLPQLTLANLGAGVAEELFKQELEKVLLNILDPNTEAKSKRSISIDITFLPGESRTDCAVGIQASSKVASFRGAGATIFVGMKHGKAVATTYDPKQMQMAWDEADRPRVLPTAAADPAARTA